jgi:hypothetical protein
METESTDSPLLHVARHDSAAASARPHARQSRQILHGLQEPDIPPAKLQNDVLLQGLMPEHS